MAAGTSRQPLAVRPRLRPPAAAAPLQLPGDEERSVLKKRVAKEILEWRLVEEGRCRGPR
jgi:hypothetical protein